MPSEKLLKLTSWEFQRALKARTRKAPDLVPLRFRAAQNATRFGMPGNDGPARYNRGLAGLILAAVELLEEEGVTTEVACHYVQGALVKTGGLLRQVSFWVWLLVTRDPVKALARGGLIARARRLWGEGIEVADEVGPDHVTLRVMSCPFQDYFWNAGRPGLADLMFAWDDAWIAQVNAAGRPVRVTREMSLRTKEFSVRFQRVAVAPVKPRLVPDG